MDALHIIALLPGIAALGATVAKIEAQAALRAVTVASWTAFASAVAAAIATAAGAAGFAPLALALAILTAFVGSIVLSFSRRHMKADPRLDLYARRIGLLVSAVLLSVTARDVLTFAAAWVASGWLLARLIGHVPGWVEAAAAERRARSAFLIGDLALVGALAVLVERAGTLSIDGAITAAATLPVPAQLGLGALLLIAAMARSAVPPFHRWLMGSMTAPTPVSALMHAGLVNAGGFLLIRFADVFAATQAVQLAAVAIGAVGALFGTGVMIVRPDVKRALGGSTVAQMSFMIMTCGLGAYAAALWHLIAHGLFKAWLFLGAGGNVGRRQPATLAKPGAPDALVVGVAAAALVLALGARGILDGPLPVPALLAVLTGLASVATLTRAPRSGAASLAVIGVSAGLALAYLGGIVAIETASGLAVQPSPLPLAGEIGLAIAFLAAWAWQLARLPLPAALYVRMLNTGGPALIR